MTRSSRRYDWNPTRRRHAPDTPASEWRSAFAGPATASLTSATRLAAHAITVAVEMGSIAGLAAADRCGACGARLRAIPEHALGSRRLRFLPRLRPSGLQHVRRRRGSRGHTMTMVAAVDAVVVAAVPIESATVCVGRPGGQRKHHHNRHCAGRRQRTRGQRGVQRSASARAGARERTAVSMRCQIALIRASNASCVSSDSFCAASRSSGAA